jgi:hypothetical protein
MSGLISGASNQTDVSLDLDLHVTQTLAVLWDKSQGDWDALDKLVDAEFATHVENTNTWMRQAVLKGGELTEDRIKTLIRLQGDPNAVPKLDKKKYQGKFGKQDYLTVLIDILRENSGNNYADVVAFIDKELRSSPSSKAARGFGVKAN